MAERKRRAKSWRDKAWYEVVAPPMFGEASVGETPAADPSFLTGRVFETTLGELIEDFSKSHIKLHFRVRGVEGSRALTTFIGHEMARDYIRSQVRRRSKKAEDVTTVMTKDGYTMRVTAMATTPRRAQGAKLKAVRGAIRKVLEERSRDRTFDQFVQEIVLGKLASDIYKEAKRYVPIRRVEVYKSKVLSEPSEPS
jgi:small subunit ribosomal protein S3Ae